MVPVETVMLNSLKFHGRKFIVVLDFFVNYIKLSNDASFGFRPLRIKSRHIVDQINYFFNWDFKAKHKSMFKLPQNGRSRCTE